MVQGWWLSITVSDIQFNVYHVYVGDKYKRFLKDDLYPTLLSDNKNMPYLIPHVL